MIGAVAPIVGFLPSPLDEAVILNAAKNPRLSFQVSQGFSLGPLEAHRRAGL